MNAMDTHNHQLKSKIGKLLYMATTVYVVCMIHRRIKVFKCAGL